MQIRECRKNGMPGFRAGRQGKCFTYVPGDMIAKAEAERLAEKQRVYYSKRQKREKKNEL